MKVIKVIISVLNDLFKRWHHWDSRLKWIILTPFLGFLLSFILYRETFLGISEIFRGNPSTIGGWWVMALYLMVATTLWAIPVVFSFRWYNWDSPFTWVPTLAYLAMSFVLTVGVDLFMMPLFFAIFLFTIFLVIVVHIFQFIQRRCPHIFSKGIIVLITLFCFYRTVVEIWWENPENWSEEKIIREIPALIRALKDEEWWKVRWNAAEALGRIGPEAKQAVSALAQALTDGYSDVRQSAAEALGQIGPAAVAALIQALKDEEWWKVRQSAAEALGRIGPEAKAAVPELIQALKDENWHVRQYAAETLGGIGRAAKAAVPALAQALKDEDSDVRESAAEALEKINIEAEATEDAEFDF